MSKEASQRAIILASGGLDSAVAAAVAQRDGFDLHLLTVDYWQRHAVEIACAGKVAAALGAREHLIVTVDLRAIGGSALTGDLPIPKNRSVLDRSRGIPISYVPGRNLIFLSIAAAHAEVVKASVIYFGANVVDYPGYPDCRSEFVRAFEAVVEVATKAGAEGQRIEVRTPLLRMTKTEIVRLGKTLGVPFHLTHSCYDPTGTVACGLCDSCLIRRQGFAEAGVVDPIPYAIP